MSVAIPQIKLNTGASIPAVGAYIMRLKKGRARR